LYRKLSGTFYLIISCGYILFYQKIKIITLVLGLASKIFSYAVRKGFVDDNPCKDIERNNESGRDRYIEDLEYQAVRGFSWTQKRWKALACAMDISYLTALREGDILKLQLSDIDNEFLRVREGKSGWKARMES
jgi:integrase